MLYQESLISAKERELVSLNKETVWGAAAGSVDSPERGDPGLEVGGNWEGPHGQERGIRQEVA